MNWKGKRPADDLNFYSLLGIVQSGMWLQADLEKYLAGYGLSFGRFSILLTLLESESLPVISNDLALRLGVSKPTVAKLLGKLVRDRLVKQGSDPADSRKKICRLTDEGMRMLHRIIPGYLERMRIIGSNISIDEKKQILSLLNKINFLDAEKRLNLFSRKSITRFSEEIRECCSRGTAGDIDQVMACLEEGIDLPETKVIDYYLGTVNRFEGMKRIEHYLFEGSQIQRNYAALFFVRINDWKLVNKAYRQGLIDYVQAYSK